MKTTFSSKESHRTARFPSAIQARRIIAQDPSICYQDIHGRIYGLMESDMRMKAGMRFEVWVLVSSMLRDKIPLSTSISTITNRYRPPRVGTRVSLYNLSALDVNVEQPSCVVQVLGYPERSAYSNALTFLARAECISIDETQ